jgi:MORN repeat
MSTVPSTNATAMRTTSTTTANSMGRYQGEWYNGKYHGQGCIVWNSIGQSYTGEFVAGQLHGQGVLKRIGGRTDEILLEGQWVHGAYQQQADPAAASSHPPPTTSAITEINMESMARRMHDDSVEDTANLSVPTADMERLALSVKGSGLGDA